MAIMSAFQAEDGGSIPLARSTKQTLLSILILCYRSHFFENGWNQIIFKDPPGIETLLLLGRFDFFVQRRIVV